MFRIYRQSKKKEREREGEGISYLFAVKISSLTISFNKLVVFFALATVTTFNNIDGIVTLFSNSS